MPTTSDDDLALIDTLPNGVRSLLLPRPALRTACVSVFIRSGSMHERRALNGIGHVVEHMLFKGTATRDAHRINLDAERLGADLNAHTDKDHTALHLRGRGGDGLRFVPMLADLVQHASFPADELARERQVLLQEFSEDEDDPMSTAYRLFDHACYGAHPVAQPAIGTRSNVERFSRDDLVRWVAQQFTGANVLIAGIGPIEPRAWQREVAAAFGGLPAGTPHDLPAPAWVGGLRSRRLDAGSQAHLVLGFPLPPLAAADPAGEMAATLFGDGMSAPLMAELRERRGLVYYAACAADLIAPCGEFVVEASFAPDKLDEVLLALPALLQAQAEAVALPDVERARNQLAVRLLRQQEQPGQVLEAAALDLLALGRVRGAAERLAAVEAVGPAALRDRFAQMLQAGAAAALAGSLPRGAAERTRVALAPLGLRG